MMMMMMRMVFFFFIGGVGRGGGGGGCCWDGEGLTLLLPSWCLVFRETLIKGACDTTARPSLGPLLVMDYWRTYVF